jgi:hypothetical protein
MHTRRIMVTEETIDLERRSTYAPQNDDDENTINLLRAALLPGELDLFAKRLLQAKVSGGFVLVGVEFSNGHARRIVYNESEILERK